MIQVPNPSVGALCLINLPVSWISPVTQLINPWSFSSTILYYNRLWFFLLINFLPPSGSTENKCKLQIENSALDSRWTLPTPLWPGFSSRGGYSSSDEKCWSGELLPCPPPQRKKKILQIYNLTLKKKN